MQKIRHCHEDRWDFDSGDSAQFPIKLSDNGMGHGFCPAKLFRDDPEFVSYCKMLFVMWKCGKLPEDYFIDSISEDLLNDLYYLIMTFERVMRGRDYSVLAQMLGAK